MSNKPVIYQTNNIRIVRRDESNVEIQRFEKRKGFQGKGESEAWVFKGFFSSVFRALHAIHMKGLLIDESAKLDNEKLVKQIDESEQRVLQAIREVQGWTIRNGCRR